MPVPSIWQAEKLDSDLYRLSRTDQYRSESIGDMGVVQVTDKLKEKMLPGDSYHYIEHGQRHVYSYDDFRKMLGKRDEQIQMRAILEIPF
jgi:hypothetical protein